MLVLNVQKCRMASAMKTTMRMKNQLATFRAQIANRIDLILINLRNMLREKEDQQCQWNDPTRR